MPATSWSTTFDAAAEPQTDEQVEAIRETLNTLFDSDVLPEGNHTVSISRATAESGVDQLTVTITTTPPVEEAYAPQDED